MTASEKLRALGKTATEKGWQGDESGAFYYEERVMAALPLIADCIEAAERVTSADEGAWHGSRLLLALTALREHLEGSKPIESVYEERNGIMMRISGPPIDLPDEAKKAWVAEHLEGGTERRFFTQHTPGAKPGEYGWREVPTSEHLEGGDE